ncbi:MAG TPA: type IV secretion system DNA-binding domain-containing protein, partial [Candidatus Angelobacter sp.]|nr:type IV secretion system DNA-binding domain-containing protein [Candidatus Angelobacter sp.]
PKREQTKGSWTAAQWAKQRHGWIFITSKPILRKKLRPLISLWLDLLVLRLMSEPKGTANRVWFVLDELASLQKLPQLHTAITENRKSGNPLVLGFHGRSQLEARYGREAEAMLSQPATKIFLRTSEERAAEWVSKMIGEVETERLRESHHHGGRDGKDFSLEPPRKDPVVMASEIMGLENLHGYLKLGNFVTSFQFPYMSLPSIARGFIPRKDDTGFPEVLPSAPRNPLPETVDGSENEEEAQQQTEMRD